MILFNLAVVFGLVALSAFFVAAEYALLSVRRTRIEQLVKQGSSRAAIVQRMLANPGLLFSGLQLGITVASLLLGWFAEDALASSLEQWLATSLQQYDVSLAVLHTVSTIIILVLITGLAIVLGELVPKTLGYERAEQVSLWTAWPMTVVLKTTKHFILLMDWISNQILRMVGFRPGTGHGQVHSAEEIKLLVTAIRRRGLLGKGQEDMILGAFDFHEVMVREVMTPWPDIVSLPVTNHLPTLLDKISHKLRSRIPVYEGSPDHIIGVLYPKDLLRVIRNRWQIGVPLQAPFDVRRIMREPIVVPENMTMDQLLEEYRKKRTQIALVVDEFGNFIGLVTLEDVLEEIVGEIDDEYDLPQEIARRMGDGVLMLSGAVTVRELADDFELQLPRDQGYETLGGFVLSRLGVIPQGGEQFSYEGHRYTVLEMEGRRITQVKVSPSGSKANPKGGEENSETPPETSR